MDLKLQVRDGRETEVAKFTDLYLCLRNSAMVSNRDAILTLFLHLTEKSARPGHPKRVPPPFTLIHPGGSLLANEKRQPPTSLSNKSVISIGSGDVIYHNRATQPGSRARSGNGGMYELIRAAAKPSMLGHFVSLRGIHSTSGNKI